MKEAEESQNAGMVVAIRIKPPDLQEDFSVSSPGQNMLTITTSDHQASYKYDFVHWSTGTKSDTPNYASQEAVFEAVGIPLVRNALQGFNCCLFAYGQTVRKNIKIWLVCNFHLYCGRALEKRTPCSERVIMKE